MELSLHDASFSSMNPSYLAACSLCLSFKLLKGPKWSRRFEIYTLYESLSLISGMRKIAKLVIKSLNNEYKYQAAYFKYNRGNFLTLNLLPRLSCSYIKKLVSN